VDFIIKTINQSFDMSFDKELVTTDEPNTNTFIQVHFGEEIDIKVICEKEINENGITLENEQFLNFIYTSVFEKIIFNSYTSPTKVQVSKSTKETDTNTIFGVSVKIEEGVQINLNYDRS
jgi:hypothetical protein